MPTTLTREEINETLCRLAAEQAAVSPAEVTPDSHLVNDLNFDSLDMVEYAMMIEDEFDVSIADEHVERVRTVKDAAEALCSVLPT